MDVDNSSHFINQRVTEYCVDFNMGIKCCASQIKMADVFKIIMEEKLE